MFIEALKQKFPQAILEARADYGDETLVVELRSLKEVLLALKNDPQVPFDQLLDLCAVDYIGQSPRFEVVYHLYSLSKRLRLRVKVRVDERNPSLPSMVSVWGTADWFEREAYDMFGIRFEGHPNLKRLLMWEKFEGHPLRKDYPLDKRQPIPEQLDIV